MVKTRLEHNLSYLERICLEIGRVTRVQGELLVFQTIYIAKSSNNTSVYVMEGSDFVEDF